MDTPEDAQRQPSTPAGKDYNQRQQHTCGGCAATWTGMSMAHCAVCHHTFGSVNSFDRHRGKARGHGGCAPPAMIGLYWNPTRRCWSEAYTAGRSRAIDIPPKRSALEVYLSTAQNLNRDSDHPGEPCNQACNERGA